MGAWSRLQQETGLRVLFVARRARSEWSGPCPETGKPVRVALDPDDRAARAFNALWKPRAYLLDEGGRLRYAQPVTTLTPQAPMEVRSLLGKTRVATAGPT